MNRTMSSLFALGIGAATFAMRNRRMSRMSMNFLDIGDFWTSRRVKRIRRRIAKAIN
ncbi:DUF3918 family protein [Fictibacillus nanhaiensis]|uniref:DUF3918 family protein n=1 Tax=Fictibacillus nanhaiensis TaxID=742169 RepID=UPI001C973ADC|nr:DUF3918 family protein [Fictibacillus nanhaiensis]MBY6035365.1 DUF3918 family protein [Fictibacillus nanhaiensis]